MSALRLLLASACVLLSSQLVSSKVGLSDEWDAAYAKANAAVAQLTLKEKVSLGTGVGWMNDHCVGNTPPIESIGFPGLCLQDSPVGVRFGDLVSVFPAGINVASTFNRTLMRERGAAMGEEFRGKGVNVALAPAMNIMRAPAAGRNWEGFGGDPYLSGEGAFETIVGIQSTGVQACAKHYINNEQEHYRESSSSNVDDRAQHEIYAYPFLRSVQAGVASVMCSYNQINGTYACENDKVLNGILKEEYGFPGYIMSDWAATHSTGSVMSGLDMTMPGDISFGSGTTYFGDALVQAVNNGQVDESRVTDMALRILAAWYLLGQDEGFPATNFDSWNINDSFNKHVNVQGNHAEIIRSVGQASTVLLKNVGNILPLKDSTTIAVVGSGGGKGSKGPNGYTDRGGNDGVLGMGWGSGTAEYPYLVAPLDAITSRAASVLSSLSDSDLNKAKSIAAQQDVTLVFITADSGEGYITVENNNGDRNNLYAWHNGDDLVLAVADVGPTIVVVNSVGPIILEAWADHENVVGIVWSGLPGQEAGNGLVDVLYGDYNPSGRLPYTIGKAEGDYSAKVLYSSPDRIPDIDYDDGIFVDYRHFDAENIEPRYEFGFGLSYTTFEYSALSISGSISSGSYGTLDSGLHETAVTVSFTLENTGNVDGNEIPQLYITLPESAGSAPLNLKGFDSVHVPAGSTVEVSLELSPYSFSYWDVGSQRWKVPSGESTISVGASSRDIRLKANLSA